MNLTVVPKRRAIDRAEDFPAWVDRINREAREQQEKADRQREADACVSRRLLQSSAIILAIEIVLIALGWAILHHGGLL